MKPINTLYLFFAEGLTRFYEKMIQSPTIYPTRHYMKHHRFRKGFSY
jgi:hypothetical protein